MGTGKEDLMGEELNVSRSIFLQTENISRVLRVCWYDTSCSTSIRSQGLSSVSFETQHTQNLSLPPTLLQTANNVSS